MKNLVKEFSELTKKERRALRLEQHYESLFMLYLLCGGGKLTGRSVKTICDLLRLSRAQQKANASQ
jgi:hypothetical protein